MPQNPEGENTKLLILAIWLRWFVLWPGELRDGTFAGASQEAHPIWLSRRNRTRKGFLGIEK